MFIELTADAEWFSLADLCSLLTPTRLGVASRLFRGDLEECREESDTKPGLSDLPALPLLTTALAKPPWRRSTSPALELLRVKPVLDRQSLMAVEAIYATDH